MKILFISEVYTPWQGGVIVAIRNLMRQLVTDGNEVSIITAETRKRWRVWGTRKEFDEECGVTVYRIPAIPYPFHTMSTMTLPAFASITKIINTIQPDCIHIFSPIGIAERIVVSYAKHKNIPIVISNHLMPENFTYNVHLPNALRLLTEKLIYKDTIRICNQVQLVTAPTKTAVNLLVAHGLKTPHEVVTNGVDASYFHPGFPSTIAVTRFRLDKKYAYILYVGRLDGEKRVDLLIQAMHEVIKRNPRAKLIIAGRGIQRKTLHTLAANLQLHDAVFFLGRITEEEKRALLQSASIFATASPSELQCISGLEALSCGLPVVAADKLALKELVDHGKNGLLFQYPNVDDLAEQICILLENKKTREIMGRNGREWVLEHHQLKQALFSFEKLYRRVINY